MFSLGASWVFSFQPVLPPAYRPGSAGGWPEGRWCNDDFSQTTERVFADIASPEDAGLYESHRMFTLGSQDRFPPTTKRA